MERWLDGSPSTALNKPVIEVGFGSWNKPAIVIPIMEIRAPRGRMILYANPSKLNIQCEAIKSFMEQHRDD